MVVRLLMWTQSAEPAAPESTGHWGKVGQNPVRRGSKGGESRLEVLFMMTTPWNLNCVGKKVRRVVDNCRKADRLKVIGQRIVRSGGKEFLKCQSDHISPLLKTVYVFPSPVR